MKGPSYAPYQNSMTRWSIQHVCWRKSAGDSLCPAAGRTVRVTRARSSAPPDSCSCWALGIFWGEGKGGSKDTGDFPGERGVKSWKKTTTTRWVQVDHAFFLSLRGREREDTLGASQGKTGPAGKRVIVVDDWTGNYGIIWLPLAEIERIIYRGLALTHLDSIDNTNNQPTESTCLSFLASSKFLLPVSGWS